MRRRSKYHFHTIPLVNVIETEIETEIAMHSPGVTAIVVEIVAVHRTPMPGEMWTIALTTEEVNVTMLVLLLQLQKSTEWQDSRCRAPCCRALFVRLRQRRKSCTSQTPRRTLSETMTEISTEPEIDLGAVTGIGDTMIVDTMTGTDTTRGESVAAETTETETVVVEAGGTMTTIVDVSGVEAVHLV